jgi:hypothetical protein
MKSSICWLADTILRRESVNVALAHAGQLVLMMETPTLLSALAVLGSMLSAAESMTMRVLYPELCDWKQLIRHSHCCSKALQLLGGIFLIQPLRAAKP